MNKDIFLTNSLGNKKDKFIPINPKKIGMYVCGPTVYDNPHIGNARPLVVFDILFKVLKCKFGNTNVTYVRNITDIDDKIIQSSLEKKISINDLFDFLNPLTTLQTEVKLTNSFSNFGSKGEIT